MRVQVIASSSSGNCTLIDDGQTRLLLDAGVRVSEIKQALGHQLHTVAGTLVTHSHADHASAAHGLMDAAVDTWMLAATAAAIGASGHRLHYLVPLQQFRLGSWTVRPFDLIHDVPNVGFLLASDAGWKVVYITDTAYCPYRFTDVSHWLLEANFSEPLLARNVRNESLHPAAAERIRRSHLGLERAIELLQANDLSRCVAIHLLHLSQGNSDEAAFVDAVARATGKPVWAAPVRAVLA